MATAAEKAAAKAAKAAAEAAAKAGTTPAAPAGGDDAPNGDNPPLKPLPDVLPEKVKLASFYGFYAEDGTPNFWQEGQEVTDQDAIAILLERGAPLVEE